MKTLIVLLLGFFILLPVHAEEKAGLELPKSGRLAGTTTSGGGQTTFESDWGGLDPSGKEAPPVSASVSRTSDRDWLVKIFNNTEDQFKASLRIVQTDLGRPVKSDSLSVSLKGGEKLERRITAHSLAKDAEVNLVKWSKTEKKLTPEELNKQIAEKKAELEKLEAQLAGPSAGE